MRVDSRRLDSQADSSRQVSDLNNQRPLTDTNFVRNKLSSDSNSGGTAMLLNAFQKDNTTAGSPQVRYISYLCYIIYNNFVLIIFPLNKGV